VALERVEDHPALGVREGELERAGGRPHGQRQRDGGSAGDDRGREIGHVDERTAAEEHGPLHGMLQFAPRRRPA
jgi:hypothetical protein